MKERKLPTAKYVLFGNVALDKPSLARVVFFQSPCFCLHFFVYTLNQSLSDPRYCQPTQDAFDVNSLLNRERRDNFLFKFGTVARLAHRRSLRNRSTTQTGYMVGLHAIRKTGSHPLSHSAGLFGVQPYFLRAAGLSCSSSCRSEVRRNGRQPRHPLFRQLSVLGRHTEESRGFRVKVRRLRESEEQIADPLTQGTQTGLASSSTQQVRLPVVGTTNGGKDPGRAVGRGRGSDTRIVP